MVTLMLLFLVFHFKEMTYFPLILVLGVQSSMDDSEKSEWVYGLVFWFPLLLGIGYLIYVQIQERKWSKGVFPSKLKFNNDNLLEAYICLGAYMIQRDLRDISDKTKYLNSYFTQYFPESQYEFKDSLRWSFNNPIEPKSVANWINYHLKEKTKRVQVLYFLAGLAMIDGQLINREYNVLKDLTPILGLTQKELDAVINMYRFKEENTSKSTNQRSVKSESKKEAAFKILELSPTATDEEIKKAYRKLVKLHHPDKFVKESPEQIRLANERFIKIQEAYDYLQRA